MPNNFQPTETPIEPPVTDGSDDHKVSIRTMQTDVAEFLQKKKSSFTQIAGQEIAARPTRPQSAPTPDIKTRLIRWGIRGFFLLFSLLAIGGLISLFISPVPRPAPEPEALRPFFATEKERGAAARTADPKSLTRVLDDIYAERGRSNTITRIKIILEDGPIQRPLVLRDFFSLLGIHPRSPTFLERMEGSVMPFFFHARDGNRFGLAARTRDPDRTLRDLILWEPTLADNLRPLFFGERIQSPAQIVFEGRIFRNIDWRWLPLSPDKDLGVAYAVFSADQLMILTTSQAGMETTLTRLLDVQ